MPVCLCVEDCLSSYWLSVANSGVGKIIDRLFSSDWFKRLLKLVPIVSIFIVISIQVYSFPCDLRNKIYNGCCPDSRCMMNQTHCGTIMDMICTDGSSFQTKFDLVCCSDLNKVCDTRMMYILVTSMNGFLLLILLIGVTKLTEFGFRSLFLFCSIFPFIKVIFDDKYKDLISCSGER